MYVRSDCDRGAFATARRAAAALLLLTYAACTGAPRAVKDPGDYIASRSPKEIILTRKDGTVLEVDAPRLHGDTLLGYTNADGQPEVVWLGLPDIEEVRVRRIDPLRTGLVVGGALVGTVALIAALSGSGMSDPTVNDDIEDSRVFWFAIRP